MGQPSGGHQPYQQPYQPYPQQHQQSWAPYPPAQHASVQPYAAPSAYPVPPYYAGVRRPLVSAGGRFGAVLLDGLLALCTLGIGWMIWSLFTWSDGQTPAKKLLGHVVADANTGAAFGWGRMAMRELCIKGLLGFVLNLVTCDIYAIVDACFVFGEGQRTLHDRLAGSIVRTL